MSSLMPLRRRIKVIKSTKKLTQAMSLVAIASHSKHKDGYGAAMFHRQTTEKIFSYLLGLHKKWHNPIIAVETNKTTASPFVVIMSPVRGMCGSFKNNLVRNATKNLKFPYYQTPSFVTIGPRAIQIAKESIQEGKEVRKPKIIHHFETLSIEQGPDVARLISNSIYKSDTKFSKIICLGSTFNNLFSQTPKIQTIFPVERVSKPLSDEKTSEELKNEKYIWEQDKDKVLNEVAKNYLEISLSLAICESLFSENAARFVAMDAATSNAEKHLETMSLEYNKLRQTKITQEVAELSSAR
ncbi:FoF1 ATP synthase subunit gamma [Candidatus Dependentiae bacterium]